MGVPLREQAAITMKIMHIQVRLVMEGYRFTKGPMVEGIVSSSIFPLPPGLGEGVRGEVLYFY